MKRRTLIRLLVGFGIGIPILIELLTFAGMIDMTILGDRGARTTETPSQDRIAVGDELLAETPATETLTAATLQAGADQWTLTLTVSVENTGDLAYELQLAGVRTDSDRLVSGGASTGTLSPGESTTVTGEWELPDGERPRSLIVIVLTGRNTPSSQRTQVPLGTIPVQG